MPRLQEKERLKVIELKAKGFTNTDIAKIVNFAARQLSPIFGMQYQEHCTIKDLPRPGRPRKMSVSDIRYLKLALSACKFDTAAEAKRNMFQDVSVQTVRRELKRLGADRAHCEASKPPLKRRSQKGIESTKSMNFDFNRYK